MNKKTKLLALLALIVMATGCYTYKEHCAAYTYKDSTKNVETNEENS